MNRTVPTLLILTFMILAVGCGGQGPQKEDPAKVIEKQQALYEREVWITRGKIAEGKKLLDDLWPQLNAIKEGVNWIKDTTNKEGVPQTAAAKLKDSREALLKSAQDALKVVIDRLEDTGASYNECVRLARSVKTAPETIRSLESEIKALQEKARTYASNWKSFESNGTDFKKLD